MKAETLFNGIAEVIPPPASDFVKITPERSGCGRYAFASWDMLSNSHTTKKIRVTVLTKWVYDNRPLKETNYYVLDPLSEINLGCDFWRGDFSLQEFDRKIVDAIYT